MTDQPVFVSVSRFAKIVRLSERTCWTLISWRKLPVCRIGWRTLVKTQEGFNAIERLMEEENASAQEH